MCVQSQCADEYREIGTGDPLSAEGIMELRLLYSGQLLAASRTNTRASLKHEIRRIFHPQLKRFWETHAGLRAFATHHGGAWWATQQPTLEEVEQSSRITTPEERYESERKYGIRYFGKKWERFGCGFVPLITEGIAVRCSIDILFLRPESSGVLIQGGDLDNRVKTIFDSLRMPKNADECGGEIPSGDENPMYCLLEDDSLISEVRVVTDNLLLLPNAKSFSANDVFLVLHVRINPQSESNWEHIYR